jgi:CheY-like chemotaxis protein/nitrogen-specific signal transduction histidine kinase
MLPGRGFWMVTGKARKAAASAPRRKRARKQPEVQRSVESVLADFAHDVRTPLTGIVALTELLSTSPLGEREKRWVAALKGSAQHLASLTTLAVDSARSGKLQVRDEPFDPSLLAREVAEGFAVRAEANGLVCVTDISPDLPHRARGDGVRLRAALENLLDNALKFTPRGRVGLTATAHRLARRRVRLTFVVSDSGIGLSADEIARLFKPFVQANPRIARRFGGSGLGLSLVKRFAQRMGGNLTVKSKRGVGSTFTLTVIVGGVETAAANSKADPSRKSLRILCVDDNAFSRVVIGTMLREFGHVVEFAASGESAIEALREGGFDLVLLDVTLPGIDGAETARRIRALKPPYDRVPILGISGHGEGAKAALAAGMNAYLVKPITPKDLMAAIAALQSKSPS